MTQRLIGIIGGTGLGEALAARLGNVVLEDMDTPFGKPSGPVLIGELGSVRIAFLARHGIGHRYNPSTVPYAANIFALKKLGVTTLIASAAVGSLQNEIEPGHLVLVDQFIDKTFRRQNTFFDALGAVHCEFAQPCCKRLREKLMLAAEKIDAVTHADGTYICMEGPQFSTRAESLMHRSWGGDLIGMTAMPEAKLAREAQMCYALVALASDYDCWRQHDAGVDKQGLLEEIIGNLAKATQNAVTLIEQLIESDSLLCDDDCDCRKALELAVWTAPETIDHKTKRDLAPLFE
ncbi:MAG: S-methyl-5'-thioadenosine phosphorylase [Planctomycetota bacterium]|nr:MAG: S-methyl-5'-thioadenosine phosphorylase [Planctomycetota bacterium]